MLISVTQMTQAYFTYTDCESECIRQKGSCLISVTDRAEILNIFVDSESLCRQDASSEKACISRNSPIEQSYPARANWDKRSIPDHGMTSASTQLICIPPTSTAPPARANWDKSTNALSALLSMSVCCCLYVCRRMSVGLSACQTSICPNRLNREWFGPRQESLVPVN